MSSFRCPNCGFLNFAKAAACKRCKTEFAVAAAAESFNNSGNSYQAAPSANFQTDYEPETFVQPRFAQQNYRRTPHHAVEGQKKGLATASLVLGIIGFFTLGVLLIGAIVGLVMGISAYKKAKNRPTEFGGKDLSVAGIVLNSLNIVFGILGVMYLGIIIAIAVPNLLASMRAANEGSAISSMRKIMGAESTYMATKGGGRCADLMELGRENLIDSVLAGGQKTGYTFTVVKDASGVCEIFATPLKSDGAMKSGNRSFYASTTEMEIRAADKKGQPANKNDPMLKFQDSDRRRNRTQDDY